MPVADAPLPTASWARRGLALLIDWLASTLVVVTVGGLDFYLGDARSGFVVLAVYVVENAVFTALAGGSFGKLATRLRTVCVDGSGQAVGLIPALARSIMIAAVFPPLIFRPDGRGLHDMAVGTATVVLSQTAMRRGPAA